MPIPRIFARVFLLAVTLVVPVVAQPGPPPPPPLPPVPVPPGNPITESKRVLGKILFWEEQLSSDNTVACGTCHRPGLGGVDPRAALHPGLNGSLGGADDVFGSFGIVRSDASDDYLPDPLFGHAVQVTPRRAPDFTGAAYAPRAFWDGRAGPTFLNPETGLVSLPQGGALEAQAVQPIQSDVEMAHEGRTWAQIRAKLATAVPLRLASNLPPDMQAAINANPTYPDLFVAAFGTSDITGDRIGRALATYERTLVPNQTPFDAFANGNPQALTPNQAAGFNAFVGPGRCDACHTPPIFSDSTFRNLGLRPIVEDPGRQGVTGVFADRGRFKVPSLRNVALRNRFFHNGQFTTLASVVDLYDQGGGPFPDNRDPILGGINLSPLQEQRIVDFLGALTDPRAAAGSFPFDRPTLRSEANPPGANLYGLGTPGSLGILPLNLAGNPENLGNANFKLGVGNTLGGAPGFFALAYSSTSQVISGVRINVDPTDLGVFLPVVMQGSGPGNGFATVALPLPDQPALLGVEAFTQWFVNDPAAAGGLASTRGAHYTVF